MTENSLTTVIVPSVPNVATGPKKTIVENMTSTDSVCVVSQDSSLSEIPINPAKLDQEPNPFEQSFSAVTVSPETITQPALVDSLLNTNLGTDSGAINSNNFGQPPIDQSLQWKSMNLMSPLQETLETSLQTYELTENSNSYLAAPISTIMHPTELMQQSGPVDRYSDASTLNYANPYTDNPNTYTDDQSKQRSGSTSTMASTDSGFSGHNNQQKRNRNGSRRDSSQRDLEDDDEKAMKRQKNTENVSEEEDKRRNFLERNRIAALKCRQRKKQWLKDLKEKVECLSNDNDQLQVEASLLKEQVINLRTILLAHKNCPVALANGFNIDQIVNPMNAVPPMNMQSAQTSVRSNMRAPQQSIYNNPHPNGPLGHPHMVGNPSNVRMHHHPSSMSMGIGHMDSNTSHHHHQQHSHQDMGSLGMGRY
ncbi:hypothetical protein CLU79DRAFT_833132 [Phycomyces nitens]|nr:hypothetical protein CLU79DRAFT_833132 [Phycomyces nitens]